MPFTPYSMRLYSCPKISFSCKRCVHPLQRRSCTYEGVPKYLLETNGEVAPPSRKRVKIDHGGNYATAISASSRALADLESVYVFFPSMF